MRKPREVDVVTGYSLGEMEAAAEDLYEHRDEAGGETVPVEYPSEVRSVVSVRFSKGELDTLVVAANAAGQPLSTYIRNVALAASMAIDLETARRELSAATRALNELRRSLGAVA
jgi:hypothetical protein